MASAAEKRELKPGWTTVRFGEVVRLSNARCSDPVAEGIERYVGLEHIDSDDLRIRRWGLVENGITFTTRFKPGQVLFGKRRAYLRKVAVAGFEGICSGDIYVFESANPEVLLPELLPFICQTERFFDYAIGTSAGSLSPRTNWKSLVNFEFALPPIEEQRKLSKVLYGVESLAESINCTHERLEAVIAGYAEALIQRNHSHVTLDSILENISYGCSKPSSDKGEGVPILRIPNVLRDELDLSDLQWISLPDKEIERYAINEGDVLLVRTNGNPAYVGRCVVARSHAKPMVFASYLIRLRVNEAQIIPDFLAVLLNSPSIRRTFRGEVRSSAGNFNINTQGIRRQKIPLPSLEEQIQFLGKLKHMRDSSKRFSTRFGIAISIKKTIFTSLGDGR